MRKLRWPAGSQGKSGGVRVIYYFAVSKDQIFLITIYSKSEKDDLTSKQINAIRILVGDFENG